MANVFVQHIDAGNITDIDDLKRVYRRILLRTHPDAVGSDHLVEAYLECRNQYEAAKIRLREAGILQRLEDKGFQRLIADLENGPAIGQSK